MKDTKYDFIGDIHGHADKLESLLQKMGYYKKEDIYRHDSRIAFFVGDFIDRGPKIKQVLEIVKPMVDNGFAMAVMGNHEYNAICYHTEVNGEHLRPHNEKNIIQHQKTLDQFKEHRKEWESYINWFKTLPIYFENEHFRVVHAHWKQKHVEYLRNLNIINLTDHSVLLRTVKKDDPLHEVIEQLLKGEEMHIPGAIWIDTEGNPREEYRIKWWQSPEEHMHQDCLFNFDSKETEFKLNYEYNLEQLTRKPIFIGHYWLKEENPSLQAPTVCCIDYSVAKEGYLAAYSWDAEKALSDDKFIF
jgi:hypothetical protein